MHAHGLITSTHDLHARSTSKVILNSSDFDYLYTKGSNNAPVDRSSLLLKFDPLLGAPVPVNQLPQQEQAVLNKLSNNNNIARALSPTLEEHETSGSNHSFASESSAKGATGAQKDFKPPVDRTKVSCVCQLSVMNNTINRISSSQKHAKMSVDVIDNDCNKTFDNSRWVKQQFQNFECICNILYFIYQSELGGKNTQVPQYG